MTRKLTLLLSWTRKLKMVINVASVFLNNLQGYRRFSGVFWMGSEKCHNARFSGFPLLFIVEKTEKLRSQVGNLRVLSQGEMLTGLFEISFRPGHGAT